VSLKAAADDLRAGTVQPGSPAAQAIADEVRLRAEYAQQDADIRWQQEQALRDATNYEELTFDQKKVMGMGDEFDAPGAIAPSAAPAIEAPAVPARKIPAAAGRKITDRTSESRITSAAESLSGWTQIPGQAPMPLEQAIALVRAKGEILDPDVIPWLYMPGNRSDKAAGRATPEVADVYERFYGVESRAGAITPSEVINPEVLPPEKAPKIADTMRAMIAEMKASDERLFGAILGSTQKVRTGLSKLQAMDFQLPRELSSSRTNWGGAVLDFGSDLDKTAYILAGDAKGASKRAAKFREAVLDAGINLEALVEHGKDLKKRIKDYAGTSRASDATGVVSIPDQGFADNGAPSPAIQQRAQARLEANNQSIDNIRRKAQQEGC
jgi:hypothetical protein